MAARTRVKQEIEWRGGIEQIASRIRGRNGGIRSSKPRAAGDDGITAYVWRLARFHSGDDPSMPIMVHFDLQDTLSTLGVEANVCGPIDEDGNDVLDYLDSVVDEVLDQLGIGAYGATLRWKGLLY